MMVIRSRTSTVVYNANGSIKSRAVTESSLPAQNIIPPEGRGTVLKRTRTRIIKVIRKIVRKQ
jgi:hypothetical protein